jgi:hypothetical protein
MPEAINADKNAILWPYLLVINIKGTGAISTKNVDERANPMVKTNIEILIKTQRMSSMIFLLSTSSPPNIYLKKERAKGPLLIITAVFKN